MDIYRSGGAKEGCRLWYFITMNKIFLLLFILLIAGAFVTLALLFYIRSTAKPTTQTPPTIPVPTRVFPELPKNNTIESSGVEINNPFLSPKDLTTRGDVLFEKNPNFEIMYLKSFDEFLITILSEPFEENRIQAEAIFLARLGVTKEDACKLRVTISPPKKDGELSRTYRLSFCE